MQVLPRIHLVGSGAFGFDMSHELDCHVYLVDGDHSWAIIDAGSGSDSERIFTNIEDAGVDTRRAGYVFLTHGHADHSGGAAALRTQFPHARVLAGSPVDRWVSDGDTKLISLEPARTAGVYPSDYVYAACPGVEAVADGDVFDFGGMRLTALSTPGHADGHMAYLLATEDGKKILFSGDCVFTNGRISVQNIHDARIRPYAESIARLDRLAIDALLPGHFSISVGRAARHISMAHERFELGLLPVNVP